MIISTNIRMSARRQVIIYVDSVNEVLKVLQTCKMKSWEAKLPYKADLWWLVRYINMHALSINIPDTIHFEVYNV